MKSLKYLTAMGMLSCSFVQMARADNGTELYRKLIGFVPDHVTISGWTVAGYRDANPKALNVEAEGGEAAIRYLGDLLAAFDRVEIDAKRLEGIAAGLVITMRFSKGKQTAVICLMGADNLVIDNPPPRRAFDLPPDQKGGVLFEKLTDSLLLHTRGQSHTWTKVVVKKLPGSQRSGRTSR